MSGWPTKIAVVVAIIIVVCVYIFYPPAATPEQASEMVRRASLLVTRGDTQQAEDLALQSLAIDPEFAEAHMLLGQLDFDAGRWNEAIGHFAEVSEDAPPYAAARRMTAIIQHRHVHQLSLAEAAYQDALAMSPDDGESLEGYAQLLGLCGRRSDAIPHVLRLIRNDYDTDLLMLLSRESGSLSDPELLQAAAEADPEDPNALLGQAKAAMLELDFSKALPFLERVNVLKTRPAVFEGLMGRALLAEEHYERLTEWAERQQQSSDGSVSSEAWFVMGEFAERQGDVRGAIRCCWEGLRIRPESLSGTNRMARLLNAAGRSDEASVFFQRVERLNEFRDRQRLAIMSEEPPTFQDFLAMVQSYYELGRHWEALAWGRLAFQLQPDNEALNSLLASIKAERGRLPLRLTIEAANPAMQIDLSEYTLPTWRRRTESTEAGQTSPEISFARRNDGFDFQYFAGSPVKTNRMYEFGGGGLGVVDFDHDGWPDIYCSQGELVDGSSTAVDMYHDCLFRNRSGHFVDISEPAGLSVADVFGQGVSVGDFNNDGFADVYVASTHQNRLWLNNGDGTFASADHEFSERPSEWTTSCLIADLNGDGSPDLYDVNYLAGDRVFERLCAGEHGNTAMCSPYDFDAAVDRVWLSDGEGAFVSTPGFLNPPPAGKGLGIVAMNVGDGHLSLFVSNDTVANFFYTRGSSDASVLRESALTAGLAFNGEGKAEACMGIAAGDADGDGALDLLVTNFLHESNTLYSTIGPAVFQDRTRELGLREPTLPVLGWGTQFLDANLDGRMELFTANGYTHDLSRFDTPYAMRPHVYEFTGNRFQRLPVSQLGAWAAEEVVARSVVTLDANRDGRCDVAMGTLDSSSVLFVNTTETQNRFLGLTLVSTSSARDALGTIVTLRNAGQIAVHQLTGGDGYQASNEKRILIGCGDKSRIDELTIRWPSGETQILNNVRTDVDLIVVEKRAALPAPR